MSWKILQGDVREVLKGLPDGYAQCVVTSPPYWGLRDYGTATWEGGDAECDHSVERWDGPKQTQGAQSGHASAADRLARHECRCGAHRIDSQLGLENSPEEYVANLVAVFREVRRVLKDDGTLWLNLGDSYCNAGSSQNGEGLDGSRRGGATGAAGALGYKRRDLRHALGASGIKHKDLVGIPWRVAFALQADGWYLRQDIIWSKPNPMPESTRDRCTKAHEYIFMLSKNKHYYYDATAIEEPVACDEAAQRRKNATRNEQRGKGDQEGVYHARDKAAPFSNWKPTRNKRSVWTVATQPFKGAHFATFPEKLVEPCILAGSAAGQVVLDPFCGSGRAGIVAVRHQRHFLGIDLKAEYCEMARQAIRAAG